MSYDGCYPSDLSTLHIYFEYYLLELTKIQSIVVVTQMNKTTL